MDPLNKNTPGKIRSLPSCFMFGVIAVTFVLFHAQPSFAGVYKWKDDQGRTHFTDDPSKIPAQYRSPSKIKEMRRMVPSKPVSKSKSPSKNIRRDDKGEALKEAREADLKSELDRLREFPAAEKQAFEEASAFLEQDIKRYESFKDRPNNLRMTFENLHNTVIKTIPEKKSMVEKLSKIDNNIFAEVTGFLQKSLAADEKVTVMGNHETKRTAATKARLKEEENTKNQLIQALKKELEKRIEEAEERKERAVTLAKQEEEKKQKKEEKETAEEAEVLKKTEAKKKTGEESVGEGTSQKKEPVRVRAVD